MIILMSALLIQTLRSRWFVLGTHAILWLLLYLALIQAGGRAPEYRDDLSYSLPALSTAPVGKIAALFSTAEWPKPVAETNLCNPFFSRYFVPPPSPAPPPPPTTRKVEVAYQGYYQAADKPKCAMVKIGEVYIVAPIGGTVANKLFVADVTMQRLTLTNHLSQTNVVPLNAKKEFEVPLQ